MKLQAGEPSAYLGVDEVIESTAPSVVELGSRLRSEHPDDIDFARATYEWVRDQVRHSVDAGHPLVTVTATQALAERTGLCFAKAHLLVALLRSQGLPAGLCYQSLADGEGGHVLHGLVAVYLNNGWHRLDPRGNNERVQAGFCLETERLAWLPEAELGEIDYPEVRVSPAPVVVAALRNATDALELCRSGLPGRL